MTRTDHQILYTALAYIAVYLKEPSEPHKAEPASILARHIERYCRENIENAFPPVRILFVNETDVEPVDQEIATYLAEYRRNGHATLPQDVHQLRTLHLRLQIRKMQQMQSMFYATATSDFLAKSIQSYLQEEIEEVGGEA